MRNAPGLPRHDHNEDDVCGGLKWRLLVYDAPGLRGDTTVLTRVLARHLLPAGQPLRTYSTVTQMNGGRSDQFLVCVSGADTVMVSGLGEKLGTRTRCTTVRK